MWRWRRDRGVYRGLTLYDMCKAMDRGMVIESTQLTHKSGGVSGSGSVSITIKLFSALREALGESEFELDLSDLRGLCSDRCGGDKACCPSAVRNGKRH